MGLDAINPIGSTSPVTRVDTAAPGAANGTNFALALSRHLEQPRAEIAQVRAEVSSLRDGGVLRHLIAGTPDDFSATPWSSTSGTPSSPTQIAAMLARQATGDTSDPYGWRAMSRQVGDSVIGPGYGAMFERQIQQESGFAPDVVTGQRRSSAGAEGIAQLMPQYYGHVNRLDPAQALQAGAQSMQQYLHTWNGDVRKALASYNAGVARVQSAVTSAGAAWETALPQETRDYLNAIVGGTRPVFSTTGGFGGGAAPTMAQSMAQLMPSMSRLGLGSSLRALSGFGEPTP
ncbi:MAG: lytic transglycosylase domain-containing protein [Chloroflexota bacterium]